MPLDSLPLTGQLRRRADRFLLLVLTAFWGITLIQGWLAGELASAVSMLLQLQRMRQPHRSETEKREIGRAHV